MASILDNHALLRNGRGVSRREFVKRTGIAVVTTALLAIGGELVADGRMLEVAGESLVRATFAGRLGEAFQVHPDTVGRLALRLADVRDLHTAPGRRGPAPGPDQREQSFALAFSGPLDRRIEQGTYRFVHDQIGSFVLFIVPMAPDDSHHYYEAIFNRAQA